MIDISSELKLGSYLRCYKFITDFLTFDIDLLQLGSKIGLLNLFKGGYMWLKGL